MTAQPQSFIIDIILNLSGNRRSGSVKPARMTVGAADIDAMMEEIAPRVAFTVPNMLAGEGELAVDLEFRDIHDFSPDRIAKRIEPLAEPVEVRRRLVALVLEHPEYQSLERAWSGLRDLATHSPNARLRVLDMPDANREQMIETAGTTIVEMVGSGLDAILSPAEGAARLDAITVDDDSTDWLASPVLGAGEMARRLGIARTTLDNWRRSHHALAFRKGIRNFVYPTRQFDRSGPVAGLARVRACFGDDAESWEWLIERNRLTGGEPPIDWLHQGHVGEVVRAADGALDYQ